MDVIVSSSPATTEEVSQLNEQQVEEKHEVQKEMALPPEYDKNDSRWTLKHRLPAEGLVELIEYSSVYINADKLAECQRLSSDSYKLAQLLLTEIFTISALRTCSWSGANDNATNIDDGHATPQLDEHATNILLEFVKEYAQIHDWELVDCHRIVKNLRQIMLQMRQKKLVPPPVINQNHSKWTLKYREPAEGLVELMEYSGVYVNADKLAVCMKLSNDCVTVARMLLNEIFTTRALSTCSVIESMPSPGFTKQSVTGSRLVLDEHALSVLLQFAVQYGHSRNWRMMGNEQLHILENIHQKMEVMGRFEKKKSSFLRHPTLAVKYYKSDSRSTLKYREPAPGLVELIEHSGVYVNANKLVECKEVSKDSVTLAQKLLTEVFTTSALCTRSLSVANNKCYGLISPSVKELRRNMYSKRELDPHAEIILLNFVDEYGLEQGFPVIDFLSIRNGMIDTMRDIREQYAFKQKIPEIFALDRLMTTEENSST